MCKLKIFYNLKFQEFLVTSKMCFVISRKYFPIKAIHPYRKNTTTHYNQNFKQVVQKHKFYAQSQMMWMNGTSAFTDIKKWIQLLKGTPSICMLIMQMHDSKGKSLFLSVEYQHGRQFKGQFRGEFRATIIKGKKEDAPACKPEAEGTWNYAKVLPNALWGK